MTLAQLKQMVAAAELHGAVDSAVVHFKSVGPIPAGEKVEIAITVEVKNQDTSVTINENGAAVPTVTQANEVIFVQGFA